MDFLFGSNKQETHSSKPRQKQLKQQIFIKQDPQLLTSLQKFKNSQKKKLRENSEVNQFESLEILQPQEVGYNDQYFNYQSQINHGAYQSDQPLSIKKQQQFLKKIDQRVLNKEALQNKSTNSEKQKAVKSPGKEKKTILQKKLKNESFKIQKEFSSPKNKGVLKKGSIDVKKPIKPVSQSKQTKKIQNIKRLGSVNQKAPLNSISPSGQSQKKISNAKLNKSISSRQSLQSLQSIQQNKLDKNEIRLSENKNQTKNLSSPKVSPKKVKLAKIMINQSKYSKPQSRSQVQTKIRQPIKQIRMSSQKQNQSEYNFANEFVDPQSRLNIQLLLQAELSASERGLIFLDKKLIGDWLGDAENLVFNALTSQNPDEYIKGVYESLYPDNQFIKTQVDGAIHSALTNINKLIEQPESKGLKVNIQKRIAPKHKDDLKQLQRLDKYRLIKIKEGEVKNKVGDLRNQLQKEYFKNKSLITIDTSDLIDVDYYSIDHPETKKAQNLIREINKRRKSEHRVYKQMINQKQIQKQKIHQIQKQYEEILNQQRKQKLRQFYQQKHLEKEKQKEDLRRKQEEFKAWIKIYEKEKPLEEKLQDQMVRKFIIPEIQDRHQKLLKIKADRQPIDFADINQHGQRYMEFKKDQQIRQKAQIQTKIQTDRINEEQASRYYKGKYRYLVLQSIYEQKNQTQPKDIEKSKKQRQLAYSDLVRYVHQSLIKKKHEPKEDTRNLIKRVRNRDGSVEPNDQRLNKTIELPTSELTQIQHAKRDAQTIDTYAQGIKNLQYIKNHVRQKLMNGEEKKPKIALLEQKQHRKDYLTELRQERMHNSFPLKQKQADSPIIHRQKQIGKSQKTINDLVSLSDIDSLKAKINLLDERVKRKEIKHRNLRVRHNLDDSKLQNEYLESINAKIRLVHDLK